LRVSLDLSIHEFIERVQSRSRQRSRIFEAFEADLERAGAFTGATDSFYVVFEEWRERAGIASGSASTSLFPLAGAAFLATGLSFFIALVALGAGAFFVAGLAFAISLVLISFLFIY
jgi:hypothetical protein